MSSEGWVDVEEHESCNGAPVSGTAPRRGGAVPEPGGGQVLVKIEASGVCHTDLHAAEGDRPVKPTLPFIPGHEGAGVVAPVGPAPQPSEKATVWA